MPRPGQVTPRAPADAEHGSTARLQRLAGTAPTSPGAGPTRVPRALPQPVALPPEPLSDVHSPLEGSDEREIAEMLFGPTQFPDEPITAGAPFGPGPSFVARPSESRFAFMRRVADALSSSPAAVPEIRRYAERIARGE
jgi:hypothetical protein